MKFLKRNRNKDRRNPVDRVFLYRDDSGEWRWTAYGFNNRKLADSGEGYINWDDAYDMVDRIFPGAQRQIQH